MPYEVFSDHSNDSNDCVGSDLTDSILDLFNLTLYVLCTFQFRFAISFRLSDGSTTFRIKREKNAVQKNVSWNSNRKKGEKKTKQVWTRAMKLITWQYKTMMTTTSMATLQYQMRWVVKSACKHTRNKAFNFYEVALDAIKRI